MTRINSPKLLNSAKGQDCTICIPGICNGNPETVVAAHVPFETKGMGIKSDDIFIAYGCSDCHAVVDYQDSRWQQFSKAGLYAMHIRGMMRTWKIMIENGLIKVPIYAPRVPHIGKIGEQKPPKKPTKWPAKKIQSRPFSKART